MIRLNLTAQEAELLQTLLKEETERLNDEFEAADRTLPTKSRAKGLVLEAIDRERENVVTLRRELLDAILCTLPDVS